MRAILVLVALALAGCAAPDSTPTNDASDNSSTSIPIVPPPIEESKDVQGSAQPITLPTTGDPCESPTVQCYHHKFDVASSVKMEASLSWGVPANDFDLYLYKGTAIFKQDNAAPPGTTAKLSESLEAASYDLVVVLAAVGQDTYKLSATFAAP